jgi:hypothetical protein
MSERVVPRLVGLEWEPNAPEVVVITGDRHPTCVAMAPHFRDADQRAVALVWQRCLEVVIGGPNDEVEHLHRLHDAGFKELQWFGEVLDSSWLTALAPMAAHPARHHFIIRTKDKTIEIAGDDVSVVRVEGTSREAAIRLTQP